MLDKGNPIPQPMVQFHGLDRHESLIGEDKLVFSYATQLCDLPYLPFGLVLLRIDLSPIDGFCGQTV